MKHKISYDNYLDKFPDAKVTSDETSAILTNIGIEKWRSEGYRDRVHEPMSIAKKGNKNPLGCFRSDETRRKIGQSVSETAKSKKEVEEM